MLDENDGERTRAMEREWELGHCVDVLSSVGSSKNLYITLIWYRVEVNTRLAMDTSTERAYADRCMLGVVC
jgi:hypothetical protein